MDERESKLIGELSERISREIEDRAALRRKEEEEEQEEIEEELRIRKRRLLGVDGKWELRKWLVAAQCEYHKFIDHTLCSRKINRSVTTFSSRRSGSGRGSFGGVVGVAFREWDGAVAGVGTAHRPHSALPSLLPRILLQRRRRYLCSIRGFRHERYAQMPKIVR